MKTIILAIFDPSGKSPRDHVATTQLLCSQFVASCDVQPKTGVVLNLSPRIPPKKTVHGKSVRLLDTLVKKKL